MTETNIIDILPDRRTFLREYEDAYESLYDNDRDEFTHGLVRVLSFDGERIAREHPDVVRLLASYREDAFTSDRELAALAIVVEEVMALERDYEN